jgi:aspartate aminotransferase-like enzyme
MIPGPTPIPKNILLEFGKESGSFKSSSFVQCFKDVLTDLKEIWSAKEVFVIAGSGTLAMEMGVANTLIDNHKVLLISHGYFGDRFIDILERRHIHVDVLSSEWGECVGLDRIKEKLTAQHYDGVIVTHVDTSTGVKANVKEIGKMVSRLPNTLFLVDGVCSTAAHDEGLIDNHIDVLITASQKAFGIPPGLALTFFSDKAIKRRTTLKTIQDSYIDILKWQPIMHDPSLYYGTPPINHIRALKVALSMIKEEGYDMRVNRHIRDAKAIQTVLEKMGFGILANPSCRAATLTNALYPNGIDDVYFRDLCRQKGLLVAGGLGSYKNRLFRLGHMGHINVEIISKTLDIIQDVLRYYGVDHLNDLASKLYKEEIGL